MKTRTLASKFQVLNSSRLNTCAAAMIMTVSNLFLMDCRLEAQTTYSLTINSTGTTNVWQTTTIWTPNGLPGASDTVDVSATSGGNNGSLRFNANTTVGTFNFVNAASGGSGLIDLRSDGSSDRTFTATTFNYNMSNSTGGGLRFSTVSATNGNLTVNIGTLNFASNANRTLFVGSAVNPTGNPILASFTADNIVMGGGTMSIGAVRRSTSDPLNVNLGNVTMTGGTINVSDTAAAFSNTILAQSLNGTSGTIRVSGSSTAAHQGTVRLVGSQNTTFSGALGDGGANRTLNLEYFGTGRQTLNGTNNYSGATLVGNGTTSGTLQFTRTAALYNGASANWTASRITVESGATLAFNVGGTGEFSAGNVTTLLSNLSTVNNNGLKAGSRIGFDTTNASGSSFTISNNITDSTGTGGGAIGLTKLGTNTLVLSGTNTYTGSTSIAGGTLTASGGSAIADAGAVSVSSGAVFNLGNSETIGSIAGAGNVTLGANTLTAGGDNTSTTLSGSISGSGGGLAKNGTGTLTLAAENTYTGATAINSGTLQIGTGGATGSLASSSILNNASLVVDRTGTLTLSGNLSESGTLTKNGSGTLVLGGSNSYTGATAINAGAIRATTSNALGSTAAGTTVASGAALELSSGITIGSEALSLAGSGISSAGALRNISGTNTYSGAITLNAATTIGSDADTLTLSGGLTGTNTNLTFAGDGNIAINASGFSIGTGTLTKTGTGALTLSTNNTYTGSTSILAGTLTANAVSAIGDTSAVSISSGAVLNLGAGETVGSIAGAGNISLGGNTLTVGGDNTSTTFSGVLSGNGGGLAKTGTGTLTISGTNTYNGSTTINAGTLFVSGNSAASAHAVEVGAVLEGTGVLGATTVNGTLQGTLAVGGLTINSGGTVSPNGNTAVGTLSTSSITINGGGYNWSLANVTSSVAGTDFDQITSTGALAFNGPLMVNIYGDPTGWNSANTYSWNIMSGASISGFNSSNFSVNTLNFNPLFGGTWSFGSNGGNLTLTYTGLSSPTWNGGTGNWSAGFTPSVANGDNIAFANATTVTATNNIGSGTLSSVGSITFNSGAGNFTLAANNGSAGFDAASALVVNGIVVNNSAYSQNINLALAFSNNASQIQATSGGFVFGNTIDTGIQLAVVGTNNVAMNGMLAGSGGISMNGTGTLTLSANNTFTGSTSINSGTLQIGAGGATGSLVSSSILNNASLVVDRTGTFTLSGNLSGSGTLTKNGSGTLVLGGSNSYTGATAINAGAIRATTSNALGSTAAGTTVASGAALELSSGITIGSEALSLAGSGIFSAGAMRNISGTNTYSGAITLNAETTIGSDADTLTLSGGLTGANTNLTLAGDGNIAINTSGFSIGTGILSKTGAGTLTLSTNNTYTGGSALNAGTIQIAAAAALGASGNITFGGGKLQYGSGISTDISSRIKNSSSAILIDTNGQNATFASAIDSTNSGGFTKTGTGTLTLSSSGNAYTGNTTVNGGILRVSNNSLGAANTTVTVNTGASINLAAVSAVTSGRSLALSGNGATGLGAIYSTSGSTTWNYNQSGGTMALGADTTIGNYDAASELRFFGASNITGNNPTLTIQGNGSVRIDRGLALGQTGSLIMNSSGNLSLGFTAGSTYNGTTSILNGTIVYLGNNALSDGTAVVINGGSLNIGNRTDTVGSVTLANGSIVGTTGILTVNSTNGGSYNMRNGTVSAILAGTAGLTKTTTGTVTLTGANTYSGATVIDDGKLEANTANSLGTNASITVNGGSLLVGADGAINTKNLTLASSATGNGTVASVIFSGSYNGTAGSLTLNQDSIIDLGEGSVIIRFSNLIWNANTTLSIYNWTGTTLWGGGNGDNPDQFYINNPLTSSELSRISFYSGIDNSSFVGTAYQLSGGSFSNEVIPVPEAETCFTALLLILGCVFWILRSCRTGENFNIWEHRVEKRENPATAVLFMGIGNRGGPFPVQLAARTDHPCSSLPHL